VVVDNWQAVLALVVAVLIAYAVILWVGTIVWTYRDIRNRTRDGWTHAVCVLLVVLFNIPGLILYLILRPDETLTEAHERRLEAEALMHELADGRSTCPRCSQAMESDYLLCPFCRTELRSPCLGCGRALELAWIACPQCGADGPAAGRTVPQHLSQPVPAPSLPEDGAQAPAPAPQPGATSQTPG
jgi:hypothetical protein